MLHDGTFSPIKKLSSDDSIILSGLFPIEVELCGFLGYVK